MNISIGLLLLFVGCRRWSRWVLTGGGGGRCGRAEWVRWACSEAAAARRAAGAGRRVPTCRALTWQSRRRRARPMNNCVRSE